MRTLSKLGLAGIRLGYAGRPRRSGSAQLDKVRPPYNVNVLTQAAALFMLERLDVLEEQAARIRSERERVWREALTALPGVTVFPSRGQLHPVRVPDADRAFDGAQGAGRAGQEPARLHGARRTACASPSARRRKTVYCSPRLREALS